MLPKTADRGYLFAQGRVERLTFSVFFRFDAATGLPAPNVAPRFVKGVIKSDAALTYAEAQTMMDDAERRIPAGERSASHQRDARGRFARARRGWRAHAGVARGSFRARQGPTNPLDVGMYVTREANQMVEEMMLLANVASAEAILRAFPAARAPSRHPHPGRAHVRTAA